ncbi:hypothetical protein DPMN_018990 [Dreissena polymorpha]|uniref:Uncharacterized protein n=1 Tax=Dreissena polymorpha TaxID=45954 RepID=A0A9D4NHI5_DREPO|nr:hypothetical protein DPMN_018990 [Dreissena polymorpha]
MLSCTPNATCPFIMSPNGDIVTNADLHSYPNNSFQLSLWQQTSIARIRLRTPSLWK